MKFRKMEIYGFKSFADKIQVKFESGVTAIVGPNGCGKSNVADAIRWVLGEQSAKALRGSSMQDVIFNGTEKRRAQSFSEVSLFFDNTEKIFPNLDFEEVVLTRKLFRSGESEYLINHVPCRLKDIIDSLRDSGLGKESYSIIGQGRIDEILSAKPEERRAVFEEAAGIAKLKNRKIEAERKLGHTRDNLLRLADIVNELEIQLGPLKKQSENAKKFLELREKLKTYEVNTYIHQYEYASSSKEIINTRLRGIAEEISLKESQFAECLENYNKTLTEIHNLDENIEKLRDELLSLTVGLEKQAGESRLVQERIQNFKDQNKRISEDLASDDNDLTQYGILLELRQSDGEVKNKILEELERKLETSTETYLSIVDKITMREIDAETTSNQMIEALDMLSNVKADASGLKAEKESLVSKKSEVEERKNDISRKIKSYQSDMNEISSSTLKLKNQKNELSLKYDEKSDEIVRINSKIADFENRLSLKMQEFHTTQSRYKVMLEMQRADEGFVSSVKKILQDSKTNASIGGRIVGVIAKLMTVPEEFETAIEMALGSSVQNLVTKNEEDAKFVIEHLKQNKMGRATFLPQNAMKPRFIDSAYKSEIRNQKGCFGIASDLVSFDSSLENVFSNLLGGTVVVDNLDTAVALARKCKYNFKIVSLDGDVINPQGSMTGGSKKLESTNIIGRDREVSQLSKDIKILENQTNKISSELDSHKQLSKKLNDDIKILLDQIHQKEVEFIKENDKFAKLKSFVGELGEEIQNLDEQNLEIERKISAIETALSITLEREREISGKKEVATESKKQTSSEFDQLKKKREQYYEELTEIKVKKASTESELVAINADIERATLGIESIKRSIRDRKLALQINLTEIAKLEKQFEEVASKSQYNEDIKLLQSVRDKLSNLDVHKDELNRQLIKFDEDKMNVSNEIQSANDRKYREEMLLSKIDSDIETLQERVFDEYELTYTTALPLRVENFVLEEGISESARLKRAIQHLGFVNVNAIEQLREVSSRYDELTSQRDDLLRAEEDLGKIIKELTIQMESKFKSEFEKINTNFGKVFKELFGGGRAELRLVEGESILEAGIDIVAEPAGKKLQSISLLSGGERALTAIAILFAILKLRPMPFCVLDEIEAALDDANATRFANYLNKFSRNTQFIIITHRKPTMELADALYGVTMEEKGVSKMVSVELSDAIKSSSEENK